MIKIRSIIKLIYYPFWWGLLTFLIVTAVLPAIAKENFRPIQNADIQNNHLKSAVENNDNSLLESGRTLYNNGRFADAIEIWQQAVKELEKNGDYPQLALTLSYLSNAYQELGQWEAAKIAIERSLSILKNQPNAAILARSLNTQGSIQLARGQTETALDTWKQAEKIYRQAGDETGILGSQINQAQALQNLGMYRRAKVTLEEVNSRLQTMSDSPIKAAGLRSLGVALQVVGDLTRSQQVLQQSLTISEQLNSPADVSNAMFSLANTLRSLKKPQEALEFYRQSARIATNSLAKVTAQLNELSLLLETQEITKAETLLPTIQTQLAKLSPSREAIYAEVNFAQSLMKIADPQTKLSVSAIANYQEIGRNLAKAVQAARILKDPRAESYSLGQLAEVYEKTQQWEAAEDLTKQALILAQQINASDIIARWQSHLGRLFKQQGEVTKAIVAYTEAVNNLKSLRTDLVAINPDVQFSFQESVEPVYRQLVGLLLQYNPGQTDLEKAREVIEALQLAELDNFFREACLDVKPQRIDSIDPTAAVIYPIILPDRLAVIVSLPGKPLQYYQSAASQADVEKTVDSLLESFNPFFSSQDRLKLSQQIYDWLIRPEEAKLAENKIKTLVFVLDGALRNLPMTALYDGKQYLIEKYALAVTPGLQLLAPRSLAQQQLKVLTAGITEARQGFSALPGVKLELAEIAAELPVKLFLDREFTPTNLQNQIQANSFSIVHLATHGQFSSNPEETFILTWNDKIKVKQFEDLLRFREQGTTNPIELLVLSACQTASGDRRAALGLAGVAVRSGARSTLGTLWSVKDQSTAILMAEFYQQISRGVSKAEALRQAQLTLYKQPKYQHPFYWAPFILVGNWL
ncbi:MAG TPA: CHAT domain-containing protein [Leptolyngbyaceae cyanobacterium]